MLKRNTGELGKQTQPGQPLYGMELTNGGFISFPGGMPVFKEGTNLLIGGVGVSGSHVDNDHTVATAMVEAVLEAIRRVDGE